MKFKFSGKRQNGEYVIRCYTNSGKRYPDGDYFTSDKDDAEKTLSEMIRFDEEKSNRPALPLLEKLQEFIAETMDGVCNEGEDVLSALVNLVDTARENHEMFSIRNQHQREIETAQFILGHRNK